MTPAAALLLVPVLAGIAYTLLAAASVRRFGRAVPVPAGHDEPVSLLKPLHGAEPRLADNLRSFLRQDWAAPIQLVAGVQRPDDPAIAVATALAPEQPGKVVRPVVDGTAHGANAKVANLLNMLPAAEHDLLVLSDSDMAVPPDYLRRLAAALGRSGVGAATCAYRGRGDAGGWSTLAAAGISYHFLPQLLVGLRLGLARPGMGSTIALRRGTLAAAGGLLPLADTLADDHALCAAVRRLGLAVAVPPLLLVHGCAERSLRELWRHERRWAATVLQLAPAGQAGTLVTHPVPLALPLLAISPRLGVAALATALVARLLLRRAVDRAAGAATAPAWLLPVRDCLSFAVLLSAFAARTVDWRGARLAMRPGGRVSAEPAR